MARVLPLLAVLACEHTNPFVTQVETTSGPFVPGDPVRLTYNPGVDAYASWLPGGASILYTTERFDQPNAEQCLAVIPASGGTITRQVCASPTAVVDSQITLVEAVEDRDGRLVYVREGTNMSPRGLTPDAQALLAATDGAPLSTTLISPIPFLGPNARPVEAIAGLQFQGGAGGLVFVGQTVVYNTCAHACVPDTIRTGIEIDRWTPGVGFTAVSNTDQASSVGVGRADTIYYTIDGDSRIFVRALSDTLTRVAYDFGAGVIARDVRAAGNRLVAVGGGYVSYVNDTLLGLIQVDRGGSLYVIDLTDSTALPVHLSGGVARRPVLSPDGTRVVYELYPFIIDTVFDSLQNVVAVDTSVSHAGDLWIASIP